MGSARDLETIRQTVEHAFPDGRCTFTQDAQMQVTKILLRIVVEDRLYAYTQAYMDEKIAARPDIVVDEFIHLARWEMEQVFPERYSKYANMGPGWKDGWYDTDRARRDKQDAILKDALTLRMEIAEAERREAAVAEELAKRSILETMAKRASEE